MIYFNTNLNFKELRQQASNEFESCLNGYSIAALFIGIGGFIVGSSLQKYNISQLTSTTIFCCSAVAFLFGFTGTIVTECPDSIISPNDEDYISEEVLLVNEESEEELNEIPVESD